MIKFIIKKFLYAQSMVEYFRYFSPEMVMPKEDSEDLNKSTEIAEWFDMTIDEVLNTKFGIFEVSI